MNFKSAMSKFLTSKLVLNIVSFLALFNVIGYVVMGNLNFVIYFIIFAVLVRYFSKNMTIVLGIPLIIVNLLALKGNIEGMTNNESATQRSNNKKDDQKPVETTNKSTNNSSNKPDTISSQGLMMSSLANSSPENNAAQSTPGKPDGFEPGRRKNRGYDIDYATTIEDAYDELNNILGSDGIQKLTSDTQNLIKQQMQLAKAMEGMGSIVQSIQPMVGQLQNMMGQVDGNGNGNGLNGIMDLAKKMTNQAAPANK